MGGGGGEPTAAVGLMTTLLCATRLPKDEEPGFRRPIELASFRHVFRV